MSVFFVQGKGWRYNFYLNKNRYAKGFYVTKGEAKIAEAKRKEAIQKGLPDPEEELRKAVQKQQTTATGMAFLDLVNLRLDHVRAYNSHKHYLDTFYICRKCMKAWGKLMCEDIKRDMVQAYVFVRSKRSNQTANKDLRYLRALFNFGIKKDWISENPTKGIGFLPVERRLRYVPPKEDVLKVLLAAGPEEQAYLYCIKETMGRMGEINRLTWEDVDFANRCVVLYTRKKKGGHLTPRRVPMTNRLFEILSRRYAVRDKSKPWVFWHTCWSSKTGEKIEGPYADRKRMMRTLCRKAGVRYFRFHALRHFGASVLDSANVNIGSIQRILGHEKRSTTEIYLHSIGSAERAAMEIFEAETNCEAQKVTHQVTHLKEKINEKRAK